MTDFFFMSKNPVTSQNQKTKVFLKPKARLNKHVTSNTANLTTKHYTELNSSPLKFGAHEEENGSTEIQLSELAQQAKIFSKQKWHRAKTWLKQKTASQSEEKKAAAVGVGVGVATGTTAEVLTGGLSAGQFGILAGTAA